MKIFIAVLHKILNVCKLVCPMLPIVIVSALPIALLWDFRPWDKPFWFVDPSIGQWIVIVLVAYTVIDTLRGMIDDIRHGHVGVDILAVVALLSTLAVEEYWASWVVVLMVFSGSAIEAYAEDKAKNNLTALMEAAPQIAHVADLPGVGSGAHAASGFPGRRCADDVPRRPGDGRRRPGTGYADGGGCRRGYRPRPVPHRARGPGAAGRRAHRASR